MENIWKDCLADPKRMLFRQKFLEHAAHRKNVAGVRHFDSKTCDAAFENTEQFRSYRKLNSPLL